MESGQKVKAALIVAHPDDEILWAGGTILSHPEWDWFVASLCRAEDKDRAPKFFRSIEFLGAKGKIGNLDDGPEQKPMETAVVQKTILSLLPSTDYDFIITHGPKGEYTRHLRHEETCVAVVSLWKAGKITMNDLWMFAYEDGNGEYIPQAVKNPNLIVNLPKNIWQDKYDIITNVYDFDWESFEAKTTPRIEAFWCFNSPEKSCDFIKKEKTK
jgi:LmbE family N-acetylglucosaminyl deacetylase